MMMILCCSCALFPGSIGFPTRRQNTSNNCVGCVYSTGGRVTAVCPRQCRRTGHEDTWTLC